MDLFLQELASMKGAKTLLLCHDHADSDAIGAAFALSRFLNGTVGVPKNVAAHTKGLIQKLNLSIVFEPNPDDYEYVIVVDTANASQLGKCVPQIFWLIDHHPDNALLGKAKQAVYDEVSSTCQLVYRILKHANVQIDQQIALALCAGIFTDTIHFHKGDAESFQAFGELFELSGLSFDEIKDLYIVDERNDRKAIIRAALQAQHIQIHEYEILVTEIDTNIPTFAARALLDLGADVSVVGYANGSEMEVRMYVRNEIQQRFALHAADILKRVKHIQKEHVWGYSLFAGYRSKGDVKDILQSVIETLKDIFN